MRFQEYASFVLIFGIITLANHVDWKWRVASPPARPPQSTVIYLSPPLRKDNGFLRKVPAPLTKPGNLLGLEAEFFEVTAYAVGDGFTPGSITADGREVRPGITAACPPEMLLGTAIYIENIGVRICEDRGNFGDNAIDVAFPSPQSARLFGKQRLAVAIIR